MDVAESGEALYVVDVSGCSVSDGSEAADDCYLHSFSLPLGIHVWRRCEFRYGNKKLFLSVRVSKGGVHLWHYSVRLLDARLVHLSPLLPCGVHGPFIRMFWVYAKSVVGGANLGCSFRRDSLVGGLYSLLVGNVIVKFSCYSSVVQPSIVY